MRRRGAQSRRRIPTRAHPYSYETLSRFGFRLTQ